MEYAIAVIDIGMTNKKVAVYDDALTQLDAVYKTFEPVQIIDPISGDQLDSHDLDGMKTWFLEQIALFAKKYPIKAISVSTHGATTVCIDKNGEVNAPCIFYTYEPGQDFQEKFYALTGSPDHLQKTTFTPPLAGMINPSKGIYFLQTHFPADFAKTDCILNYPQYWGFVFTGVKGAEPTYNGCHTYLWNHENREYSPVTDALKIRRFMSPNFRNTNEKLGTLTAQIAEQTGLPQSTIVTMGIHDSNASLLPYLAREDKTDFVLNSTGTWCVSMHPQEKYEFNDDDIGKIVFFNQSALCKPVKTSIFLGGMELDTWITLFQKLNNTDKWPQYTDSAVNSLFTDCDTFLSPELVSGSGQFTSSKSGIYEKGRFYSFEDIQTQKAVPAVMHDEAAFFALLDASLVIQTETALRRAGLKDDTRVFTEGGFRKNKLYNALLARALPQNPVFLTNIAEATAFGAAMTAVTALTGKTYTELAHSINIEYVPVLAAQYAGYETYRSKWLSTV